MELEQAAFINLVALARADGTLSSPELAMIERHREALGVSEEFAKEVLDDASLSPRGSSDVQGTQGDRLQVLKMMIRVAYADNDFTRQEKRLIDRLARSFGIGRLAINGLCLEIERELGIRRKLRLSQTALAVTVIVSAAIIIYLITLFSERSDLQQQETQISFDELKQEMGLERTSAEEALAQINQTYEAIAEKESALADRIAELEKMTAERQRSLETLGREQREKQASVIHEMARLRSELTRIRTKNMIFQEIEKEYNDSIVLIFNAYDLVTKQDRVSRSSMGSGFVVSSQGHIVTNKHVVQPWKFSAEDIALLDNGYTIDPASMLLAAWPAGEEIKTKNDFLNLPTAYSNVAGTLALHKATPDTFETKVHQLASGVTFQGQFHTGNEGDLAVLKATSNDPFKAIPLALADDELEKLDPVMVLGFPIGLNILESTRAETSPSLGEVRKIERSIMVTAPIFPGNSGGPLVDLEGHVVGVASGIYGESTLGTCIPTSHIFELLPSSTDFLKEIPTLEAAGHYRAALDDLRLADRQCTDDTERRVIETTKSRILAERDSLLEEAKLETDLQLQKDACISILNQFGPHWAKKAQDLLNSL